MIEFKQVNEDEEIIYRILNEHLTIWDMMQKYRYFLLAIGYHPESVEKEIEAE